MFQANDKFWKVKYDHEAAKKAKKAKESHQESRSPQEGKQAYCLRAASAK